MFKKLVGDRKNVMDFLLYFLVGVLATLVEWALFYILNTVFSIHYSIATTIAFLLSTFSNWGFGRLLVFKKSDKSFKKEISQIYIVAIVGLLANLFIMWVGVDLLKMNQMLVKVLATGIVFVWNYLIRKLVIYSNKLESSEKA